jgi:hypothetical protein
VGADLLFLCPSHPAAPHDFAAPPSIFSMSYHPDAAALEALGKTKLLH